MRALVGEIGMDPFISSIFCCGGEYGYLGKIHNWDWQRDVDEAGLFAFFVDVGFVNRRS